jgi:hypothetical protein
MFRRTFRDVAARISALAVAVVTPTAVFFATGAGADPAPGDAPGSGPMTVPASTMGELPRTLPVGDAPERGLQVKTILVSRAVSAQFPEISTIIGVRPDSRPWHPNGLAIDVMIPDAGSPAGVALGNRIFDYVMGNAERFAVQDVIWRGVYHTPAGPGGSGYGHWDHLHITTFGGGFPNGSEQYVLE